MWKDLIWKMERQMTELALPSNQITFIFLLFPRFFNLIAFNFFINLTLYARLVCFTLIIVNF